jgi:dephospho-CoA kinase
MNPPFGEAAVLKLKPSWLIVVPRLIFPAFVAAVVLLTFRYFQTPRGGAWALTCIQWLTIAAALLGMGLIVIWLPMQYLLTDARAMSRTGWLVRTTRDIPLENVQHIVMQQSPWETITGTGTILFATAGTDGYALAWQSIPNPQSVLDRVRAAHDQARNASRVVHTAPAPAPVPSFKVIGLVGGIGSGKSAVAAALARRNYVVIDADKDAKAALERPDVRDTLVQWWGPDILTEGRIDRKKVAAIVFADADQRTRLESLIHPIVRADRHATIARARRESRPGVVIDAPLLFEAGSDKDCDLIWFVDAPLEQRQQRVRSRGWTDEELTRREAAQLPLDEKRRRSTTIITNDANLTALGPGVDRALQLMT